MRGEGGEGGERFRKYMHVCNASVEKGTNIIARVF